MPGHEVEADRQDGEHRGDQGQALHVQVRLGDAVGQDEIGDDGEQRRERARPARAGRPRRPAATSAIRWACRPYAPQRRASRRRPQPSSTLPELNRPRGVTIRMTTRTRNGNQSEAWELISRIGALGEHAQQQAAEHRRRRLLGAAADHHGDEAVGAEGVAEIGIGEGAGSDQHAGDAGEEAGDREGDDRDHRRVGADRRGHLGIGGDRHAELAEQRALADELEADGQKPAATTMASNCCAVSTASPIWTLS